MIEHGEIYTGEQVYDYMLKYHNPKPEKLFIELWKDWEYKYLKDFDISLVAIMRNNFSLPWHKEKLVQPILVHRFYGKGDYLFYISDGNHRVAYANSVGIKKLPAFVLLKKSNE